MRLIKPKWEDLLSVIYDEERIAEVCGLWVPLETQTGMENVASEPKCCERAAVLPLARLKYQAAVLAK